jgi:hypothetical protein
VPRLLWVCVSVCVCVCVLWGSNAAAAPPAPVLHSDCHVLGFAMLAATSFSLWPWYEVLWCSPMPDSQHLRAAATVMGVRPAADRYDMISRHVGVFTDVRLLRSMAMGLSLRQDRRAGCGRSGMVDDRWPAGLIFVSVF